MTDQPEPTVQTGTCACGAEVTRELPAGKMAAFFARTPFVCDPCIAEAEERDRAELLAFQQDMEIRRIERAVHVAGIPARFCALNLSSQDETVPAVAAAQRWVDRDTGGLVLTGPVGVGKTHLAAAAARSLINAGGSLHWMSGPTLFARLSAGLGTDDREQITKILTGNTPLVLDDLDKTRPTEYGAENVFLAIDGRTSNDVPLLVTTNLSLAELATRWPEPYGEAIASRLAGYCEIVKMTGPDRRVAA